MRSSVILIFNKKIESFYLSRNQRLGSIAAKNAVNTFLCSVLARETNF